MGSRDPWLARRDLAQLDMAWPISTCSPLNGSTTHHLGAAAFTIMHSLARLRSAALPVPRQSSHASSCSFLLLGIRMFEVRQPR